MRDGVGPAILVILGGICLIALFLALGAFFPLRIERTRRAAEGTPGRSFFAGLVNALFAIGLVLVMQGGGEGLVEAVAILLAAIVSISIVFGLTAMAQLSGERLFPHLRPVPRTISGAAVLILASLTPYLGWFAFFPYIALRGLGAFLLGWWTGRGTESPAD